jgi:hypothetical protein
MDVLYKGGDLVWTQISSVARILLALPICVLQNAYSCVWGADSSVPSGSCVFYEGVVTHARKRPVANAFE